MVHVRSKKGNKKVFGDPGMTLLYPRFLRGFLFVFPGFIVGIFMSTSYAAQRRSQLAAVQDHKASSSRVAFLYVSSQARKRLAVSVDIDLQESLRVSREEFAVGGALKEHVDQLDFLVFVEILPGHLLSSASNNGHVHKQT